MSHSVTEIISATEQSQNGHSANDTHKVRSKSTVLTTPNDADMGLLALELEFPHVAAFVRSRQPKNTTPNFNTRAADCLQRAIFASPRVSEDDVKICLNLWAGDGLNPDAPDALAMLDTLPMAEALRLSNPEESKRRAGEYLEEISARPIKAKPTTKPNSVKKSDKEDEAKQSQADALLDIARRESTVLRDEKGESFVTVRGSAAKLTYPLTSQAFRGYLARRYNEITGRVASNNGATQAVITTLQGVAEQTSPVEVFVRVAASRDAVYYDLGGLTGSVVEITADGWRLLKDSPVPFIRPKGMLPQAEPLRGGSLESLREIVNVEKDDFILYVAFLISFFQPKSPRPHLGLIGEQGSGKTATTTNTRRLLDPNAASTRKEPKEARDLAVAGKNNAVLAFDNLSHLPSWLSDMMCCLSTGAGFATRANYTDDEEAIFAMSRPVIFNAISEVAKRPDLLDRTILLELPSLCEDKRKQEQEQEQIFQKSAPYILGLLFDAVSYGLKNLPNTRPEKLPRMADFATWAAACMPALGWTSDEFLETYNGNRAESQSIATDLSTIATVIERWAERSSLDEFFTGTPQELHSELCKKAAQEEKVARDWPQDAQATGTQLQRIAPALRAKNIFAHGKRSNGRKRWILAKTVGGTEK